MYKYVHHHSKPVIYVLYPMQSTYTFVSTVKIDICVTFWAQL